MKMTLFISILLLTINTFGQTEKPIKSGDWSGEGKTSDELYMWAQFEQENNNTLMSYSL